MQSKTETTTKQTVLRLASALHNFCNRTYKEHKCPECPFHVNHGCNLYPQPITWDDKLTKARKS